MHSPMKAIKNSLTSSNIVDDVQVSDMPRLPGTGNTSELRGLTQYIADLRACRVRELEEKRINKVRSASLTTPSCRWVLIRWS